MDNILRLYLQTLRGISELVERRNNSDLIIDVLKKYAEGYKDKIKELAKKGRIITRHCDKTEEILYSPPEWKEEYQELYEDSLKGNFPKCVPLDKIAA